MRIKKAIQIIGIIIIILMSSCEDRRSSITVEMERPTIPVLINKDVNPVIRVELIRNDTLPDELRSMRFSLDRTTTLDDIAAIGLYGTDHKGMLNPENVIWLSNKIRKNMVMNIPVEVDRDTLSLWVGVKLSDTADLEHRITVDCKNVSTSYGKARVVWSSPKPLRIGVALRRQMQDGVHTSRIPGLAKSKNGTLLAIFDARRDSGRDLQGDMDIALHRSVDKGATWMPMQVIMDMGEWGGLPQKYNGVSDACILTDENTGDIFVAGLWMYGALDGESGKWIEGLSGESTYWIHQWKEKGSQPGVGVKQTSQFLITKSSDNGETWSEPRNITAETKRSEWWLFAPAPGNGITLADGTLVFPTQGRDSDGLPFSNITWSRDGGETWKTSEPAYGDVTECAVVELDDGSLMLNMRDNRNRNNTEMNGRRICTTDDLGLTWTEHATSRSALKEPTCMGSLYKHRYSENGEEKSVLLFSNPDSHSKRNMITLKASFDDGLTWPQEYNLLLDEYPSRGYSSITSVDDQTIGILYESSQSDLVFLRIGLAEILTSIQ